MRQTYLVALIAVFVVVGSAVCTLVSGGQVRSLRLEAATEDEQQVWIAAQMDRIKGWTAAYQARTEALAKLPEYQAWEAARKQLEAVRADVAAKAKAKGIALDLDTGKVVTP